MGNSYFWFWPDPPGDVTDMEIVQLNLRRTVAMATIPGTAMQQAVAEAWTGRQTTVQWGGRQQVRIRLEWGGTSTDDYQVRRGLMTMLNHLDRGGNVMFAVDVDKFYVGVCAHQELRGSTTVGCTPMFEDVAPGVDLTNAEIVMRSSNPDCLIEAHLVSSHVSVGDNDRFTLDGAGVAFDYTSTDWSIVREFGSWPALRLPESERGRPHLSIEGTAFVLDLPLEEDESRIAILAGLAPTGPIGSIGAIDPNSFIP